MKKILLTAILAAAAALPGASKLPVFGYVFKAKTHGETEGPLSMLGSPASHFLLFFSW